MPERLALAMKTTQTETVWLPKDPDPKQRRRRQSRHCSWGRWPRFPQQAHRPHPSDNGSESAFTHPVHGSKRRSVRRSAPRPGSATHGPCVSKLPERLALAMKTSQTETVWLPKDPDPKPHSGGQAATVAGDAGPGFHNWPSGHIPQTMAPNPLLRIRSTAQKFVRPDVRRRDRGQRPTAGASVSCQSVSRWQ